MATHIENRMLDFPLGLEFLMNIKVNTLWQKIKAPQLCGVFILFTLTSVVISTSHTDDQSDPGWSCGCFVAVN